MNKKIDSSQQDVLDSETLQLLSSAPLRVDFAADKMQIMRTRLMARIDKDASAALHAPFLTIRANDDGPWVDILPKVGKKRLHFDLDTDTESYLLRVQPGAVVPSHYHEHNEHCLMLTGDLAFEDLQLNAGDYHLAPKGSRHSISRSIDGALLFIQTGAQTNILVPLL